MPSSNGDCIRETSCPKLKARSVICSHTESMRKIVYGLVMLLNFADVNSEDIKKYIQPYDIFDDDEFYELMNQRDNGEGIQKVASQKARLFRFGYCNYPNETSIEALKTIQKTGTRQGIVIISENPIIDNVVVKFRLVNEGKPGMSCIGFGICDKSCLNFCPFTPTRNFGPFICYYTYKKIGHLNMGELGDKFISGEYDKHFGINDCINLVIDIENYSIAFGINDIMLPEKSFNPKKIPMMHLAVWLNDPGDEVQLIYEY